MATMKPFDSLYLENPPNNLEFIQVYQEKSYNGQSLSYFEGNINLQRKCYIRKFTSTREKIRAVAAREVDIILKLRALNIRDNAIAYFFIDEEASSSYILVSEFYPIRLSELVNECPDKKLIIISNLIKLVYLINSKSIYYFLLNPDTVFIDENDLILGDHFLADQFDFGKDYEELFNNIRLTRNNYLQPDFDDLLDDSIEYYKNDLEIFRSPDFGSLHLIVLFLYDINFKRLPVIPIQNTYSLLINYKTIKNCPLFKVTNNLKIVEIITMICLADLNIKSLSECFELNEIKLYYSLTSTEKLNTNFKTILKSFQKLQNNIFTYRTAGDIFCNILYKESQQILANYYDILQESKNKFLNTPCFSTKIDVLNGILYFIWVFLVDMTSSQNLRENFQSSIQNQIRRRALDYYSKLKTIKYLCPYLQDYILIGLTAQSYNTDWNYFFESESFFLKLSSCFSLIFCCEILQKIQKLLMHKKVINILSKFLDRNLKNQILDIIFNHALPRVYIIPLPTSLHGFTTHNLNIFLNIYDLKTIFNPPPRYLVAWFLTLFHELAHFLRRYTSNNFFESRSRITPRKINSNIPGSNINLPENLIESTSIKNLAEGLIEPDSINNLTENLINERGLRGEVGREAEEEFWEPQSFINDTSASYFLEGDFESDKFMSDIKKKNLEPSPCLSLSKSQIPIFLLKGRVCGVSRK